MDDNPIRIGDAERDTAVSALQEHHAAGRLTLDEFNDRLQSALGARTDVDLESLFVDLPEPQYVASMASSRTPVPSGPAKVTGALTNRSLPPLLVTLMVWATILTVIVVTRGAFWWLIFVAGGLTSAVYSALSPEETTNRKEIDSGEEK